MNLGNLTRRRFTGTLCYMADNSRREQMVEFGV